MRILRLVFDLAGKRDFLAEAARLVIDGWFGIHESQTCSRVGRIADGLPDPKRDIQTAERCPEFPGASCCPC